MLALLLTLCSSARQVPVLPGSGLLSSEEEAGTLADGIGYPVLLKVRHALEFVPACCFAMKR